MPTQLEKYFPRMPGWITNPEVVPVVRWIYEELQRVAAATSYQHDNLQVRHVAPPKPRTGMLVYADGTNWDPGSGEGVYVYLSTGSWSKL